MKPDEFNSRLRSFEAADETSAPEGVYLVARLTKQLHNFEAPFDESFRDLMIATATHLMNAGLRILYAYTYSNEISVLFQRDDNPFGRKLRKLHSILASEAGACFSLALGATASFDCRIYQLPNEESVIDYFRWRQADAKIQLLASTGTPYDKLPLWQTRGIGLFYETIGKVGLTTNTRRRHLRVEMNLPHPDAYAAFLAARLQPATTIFPSVPPLS